MRVLVDVDGILANFVDAALDVVEEVTGRKFDHDDVHMWDITQLIECDIKKKECKKLMDSPGFATSFAAYDGAIEAIKKIRNDYELFFVTSPMHSNRSWMPERVDWLCNKFGTNPDHVNFVKHKYIVRGDVLIDDSPTNVMEWERHNPKGLGLLWTRKYNENDKGPFVRVSSWSQVFTLMERHKKLLNNE